MDRDGEDRPAGREALQRLSAMLAVGAEPEWGAALEVARSTAPANEVEEIILQSYLFVGFPVILRVLALQRGAAPAPPAREDASLPARREAGERLCRRIYGPAYERLRAHVEGLHPDLDRWMIEEGYGKVLSRPVPDVIERELCIVALLAAAGHLPQVKSHVRGAVNVGATRAEVEGAVAIGLRAAADARDSVPWRGAVLAAMGEVLARAGAG
ncbi:MAG: carboxymuconolactone decarboxylase family protein [Gemmatimonadota bacterium]|nr:carboxymuconolactone decarboxylase family protein [Gemmatimonadota bacterium]